MLNFYSRTETDETSTIKTTDSTLKIAGNVTFGKENLVMYDPLFEPGHEKMSYVICEQQRRRSACASTV